MMKQIKKILVLSAFLVSLPVFATDGGSCPIQFSSELQEIKKTIIDAITNSGISREDEAEMNVLIEKISPLFNEDSFRVTRYCETFGGSKGGVRYFGIGCTKEIARERAFSREKICDFGEFVETRLLTPDKNEVLKAAVAHIENLVSKTSNETLKTKLGQILLNAKFLKFVAAPQYQ